MKIDKIRVSPKWGKSKEEFWADTFEQIAEESKPQKKLSRVYFLMSYAAAAVLVFTIGLTLVAQLYVKTIEVGKGEHLTVNLPDNSEVIINAESKLSYKPLWWLVTRETYLQGEAFFKVKKGSTFTVFSDQKSVEVLGTSFNIYSRDSKYSVTCLSGQVQVQALEQSLRLLPDMNVVVNNNKLELNNEIDGSSAISWTQNRFSFIGVPLVDVVAEIERQYNIKVRSRSALDYQYTGHFSKTKRPEEVLEIVGKPFGIQFKIE